MGEKQLQTLANHVRRDPPFHFFVLPVFAAALIWAVVRFFTHLSHRSPGGNFRAFLVIVLAAAALTMVVRARQYSLKVQDRVIRLEERLRLMQLLPEPLRGVLGSDARRHDEALARWAAAEASVSHAPIEVELNASNMAEDGFHPGEPVYRACGEALATHVAEKVWPRLAGASSRLEAATHATHGAASAAEESA